MQTAATTRRERIRQLNDQLRTTFDQRYGKILLTQGVGALESDVRAMAIRKTATFDAFDTDNDPHGEHDFGSFELSGHTFFWKIDYYVPDLQGGSEDPSDFEKTARVLTLMLAEEY